MKTDLHFFRYRRTKPIVYSRNNFNLWGYFRHKALIRSFINGTFAESKSSNTEERLPLTTFLSVFARTHPHTHSNGEVQQNPSHRENPANAPIVAEQGQISVGVAPLAAGCAGGICGDLRGEQATEVHRPRVVPEPPHFQATAQPGRGGVRLRQLLGAVGYSVRRIALRRDP